MTKNVVPNSLPVTTSVTPMEPKPTKKAIGPVICPRVTPTEEISRFATRNCSSAPGADNTAVESRVKSGQGFGIDGSLRVGELQARRFTHQKVQSLRQEREQQCGDGQVSQEGWSLVRSEDRNGVGSRFREHENGPARQAVEAGRGKWRATRWVGSQPAASKMAAVKSSVSVETQRGRSEAAAEAVSPPARLKPSKMGKIRFA